MKKSLHARCVFHFRCYLYCMSAIELLKRYQSMPARERNRFVDALLSIDDTSKTRRNKPVQRVKWPDVEARAKKICGDRMIPNMVMLERDESAY